MGGGLLQLVAHGAQDAYLTGNPQITFWKGLFKRHTNFAMEPFRINLTGMPMWGQKQSATLGRHADLAYSTYLSIVLPSQTTVSGTTRTIWWNNEQGRLGYNLLDYVEIEVGGQLIDRLYSEWLYLWDTLSSDYNTSFKLNQMVSGGPKTATDETAGSVDSGFCYFPAPTTCTSGAATGRQGQPNVVYVPLPFFYTKNPGAALPLIALQYHEVKININWNKAQFVGGVGPDALLTKSKYPTFSSPAPPPPTSVALYVDYIYLDVDERRRMAQESHEYLIEQVQFNEDKGISAASNRIDLTFNHPVKELVWVVQPERYTNCKIAEPTAVTAGVYRPDAGRVAPFTYTYPNQSTGNALTQPIYEQWLQINGQDRMDRRFGDYFNKVQPFQHHSGTMKPIGFDTRAAYQTAAKSASAQQAIYSYSFALKPEEQQPSGTCNFSRIDTATIVMNMSGDYVIDEATDNAWNVRVYATNYNILRIMSGMAGLAYAN
jgi:hypothetical protein